MIAVINFSSLKHYCPGIPQPQPPWVISNIALHSIFFQQEQSQHLWSQALYRSPIYFFIIWVKMYFFIIFIKQKIRQTEK